MDDRLRQLQEEVEERLVAARELALLRAFARSQGVVEVRVPSEKTRDVTDKDSQLIAKRRGAVSELIWLHHERDAVCVETGLTSEQVAGVLGGLTRANGNGHAVRNGGSGTPRERQVTRGITKDPSTWPERAVERGGKRQQAPIQSAAAVPDDVDHQIVVAVRRACDQGQGDWQALRRQIACVRRLWPHSIAGIVARARQLGQLPKAAV
jgi:hypothetical protein